jgi:hypothetical protein
MQGKYERVMERRKKKIHKREGTKKYIKERKRGKER